MELIIPLRPAAETVSDGGGKSPSPDETSGVKTPFEDTALFDKMILMTVASYAGKFIGDSTLTRFQATQKSMVQSNAWDYMWKCKCELMKYSISRAIATHVLIEDSYDLAPEPKSGNWMAMYVWANERENLPEHKPSYSNVVLLSSELLEESFFLEESSDIDAYDWASESESELEYSTPYTQSWSGGGGDGGDSGGGGVGLYPEDTCPEYFRVIHALVDALKLHGEYSVDLCKCKYAVDDNVLTVLAMAMPGLRCLNVIGCTHVSNLLPLSMCTEFRELDLTETRVDDLSRLPRLTNLSVLYLTSCREILDFSILSECTALVKLDLSFTFIHDLPNFSACCALRELVMISCDQLSDFSGLEQCAALEILDLSNTVVSDLTAVSFCTALRSLNLNATRIEDDALTVLSACTALEELDVSETGISCLEGLPDSLKALHLASTYVYDLDPLEICIKLDFLDLQATGVCEIAPLFLCVSLKTLFVDGTDVERDDLSALADALPKLSIIGEPNERCDSGGWISEDSYVIGTPETRSHQQIIEDEDYCEPDYAEELELLYLGDFVIE